MNKIKNNIIPFIFAVIIIASCVGAWVFFHPASTYHERYSFVVRYENIGTLSPGNRVAVRGITKGQITKVELTEDAVYVTAEILADTKIPKNSSFRLINAGLMGEREMSIVTGNASDFISNGDTLNGFFDKGTSGLTASLTEGLADLDTAFTILNNFIDSLTVGSQGKSIERIIKKGSRLMGSTSDMINALKTDGTALFDKLDNVLNASKQTLENVKNQGNEKVSEAEILLQRVNTLLEELKNKKEDFNAMLAKLNEENNTAGLVLSADGNFQKDLKRLTEGVDLLLKDVKKQGIKINIDFF